MNTSDILEKIAIPLIAAFLGAILSFIYQNNFQKRNDKLLLLKILMAYRNEKASSKEWVAALNTVVVVFYKNEEIRELVRNFYSYTKQRSWNKETALGILDDLVWKMALDIGYSKLRRSDITEFYGPEKDDTQKQP